MAGVDHALPAPCPQAGRRRAWQRNGPSPSASSASTKWSSRRSRPRPQNLPQVQGELLHSPHLYGCWTSRIYLKQANDRCCRLLETWAEPLASLALWSAGIDLRGELRTAWRQLVLNHPHDSICGCSIDEVHREMMARFDTVETIGPQRRGARRQPGPATGSGLPRPEDRRAQPFDQPDPGSRAHASDLLELRRAGRSARRCWSDVTWPDDNVSASADPRCRQPPADVQVVEQHPHRFRRWRPNGNPTRHAGRRFRLAIQPAEPLPACGFSSLKIEPLVGSDLLDHTQEMEKTSRRLTGTTAGAVRCSLNVLENETLRIEVKPDGSCDLTHKPTGRTFQRLCTLADFGEAGDSYTHITPIRDEQVFPQNGSISVTTSGPLFNQIEVRTKMLLPATRSADKRGRSKRRVSCLVTVRYSLGAGWPYAKIEIDFANRARHHLLRALFPSDAAGRLAHPGCYWQLACLGCHWQLACQCIFAARRLRSLRQLATQSAAG